MSAYGDEDWREFDPDFELEQMSPWRNLDDYETQKDVFLDDPDDYQQDFF